MLGHALGDRGDLFEVENRPLGVGRISTTPLLDYHLAAAKMDLVRLAIPRRTYTQSHMDYVADCAVRIKSRADKVRGYKFTFAPELLRHFTARFEPL